MTGKVLELAEVITPDQMGCEISRYWMDWKQGKQVKELEWEEVRKYLYATDTTTTTNSKLPWKNKTTLPKLCQTRDLLYANYVTAIFPKNKWLTWVANDRSSAVKEKRDSIQNYMSWVVSQPNFKYELQKLILDYIDYGNCFATIEWVDHRKFVEDEQRTQVGYVGPQLVRIAPTDIVMNPIAASFDRSPKIVRSLMSLGEVKEKLERLSNDENREFYENLFKYMREIRDKARQYDGDFLTKDEFYRVDGFTSFRHYLCGDYVELLTFYGDLYDYENDEFLRNYSITVVDRHKVIDKKPNPSYFDHPPIYHVGWRPRQDNLWAMGPLDNLVGVQYRIDHLENLKADIMDVVAFPVQVIKGQVSDFVYGPMAKILLGDDGEFKLEAPQYQALQLDQEIMFLMNIMEEAAGAPKEAAGFRTPGEKTKYEFSRLENAASRVFSNRTNHFCEQFVERALNGMLEMSSRNLPATFSIRVFDDDLKAQTFATLTPEDVTGIGRIVPRVARHHAERAELIQNLSGLAQTPIWQHVAQHYSPIQMANMLDEVFETEEYGLVRPNIAVTEQADTQRLMNASQEQVLMEAGTPSGLSEDDVDLSNPNA